MSEWTLKRWHPNESSYVIEHNTCDGWSQYNQKVYGDLRVKDKTCCSCGKAPPKDLLVGLILMNMGWKNE
jgi:hypothetical protein